MNKKRNTVSDLVDALGGTKKVAESLGVGPSAVSNWRAANELPDKLSLYQDIRALCIAESVPLHERLFARK